MSKINIHMETHMEEKSVSKKKCLLYKPTIGIENEFNCDVCDKYFPTITSLNKHVRIIHKKQKTKQNNNINTKPSTDSLNLRRNQTTTEPKEYNVCQNSYSVNEQTENSLGRIKIETDIIDGNTFTSILTIENYSITNFDTNISNPTSEENTNDKIKIEAVTADNNDKMIHGGYDDINAEKVDDFLSGKHLNSDVISSINKESMKTCALCNTSFFKKYLLRKHMKSHMKDKTCSEKKKSACLNAEKKFKCLVCNKQFTASSTMKVHTRIFHTEKKIYKCNKCHKSFSDIVYLRRHRKYHDEKPYQCEVCQKSFPQMSNLKVHMNIHAGIKPWKCDVCERSYADKTSFKRHMQYHNEGYSFKCNLCNRILKRRNSLKKHMISHINGKNSGNKKYDCNICEKSYNTPFVLKRHKTIHTGEKQFICDICKKSFGAKAHMKRHIIIIHMQENKYKCHICNKLFSDVNYFKVHKTLHDNSKPYGCNFCKKSFSHRTFLTIHLRNHRTRHECKICKKLYPQKKILKIHMKIHHSE
ncbi:zinc finger protein OZF-like [Sipha flava]|uniref:Zinc finger protein OZF-like n=1 Tax=Sipha flava TaxID=143950 RepID=A0A8B8F9B2_9HEMI|nr:zinc finger protein OZF-like [Sipha flava]